MTGSIAVSQCGHTPNRPGHHGTVVASTVGTVAISCNGGDFTCGTLAVSQADKPLVVNHCCGNVGQNRRSENRRLPKWPIAKTAVDSLPLSPTRKYRLIKLYVVPGPTKNKPSYNPSN